MDNYKDVTFVYCSQALEGGGISDFKVYGTWDHKGQYVGSLNELNATPMEYDDQGDLVAIVSLLDDGPHDWRWCVSAVVPGKGRTSMIFCDDSLSFDLKAENPVVYHRPSFLGYMGPTREGDDLIFRFWAPHARRVHVKIWTRREEGALYYEMTPEGENGLWTVCIDDKWDDYKGSAYAYRVVTSEGAVVYRGDPYAFRMQGSQLGLGELFLHPLTGEQVHRYYEDPVRKQHGLASCIRFYRFELQGYEWADKVLLRLYDEERQPLSRAALRSRLGTSGRTLVNQRFSEFWSDRLTPDGAVSLVDHSGAWSVIFNRPELMEGWYYEFEIYYDSTMQVLSDPYSNRIDGYPAWPRYPIIDPCEYVWKNDSIPRLASRKEEMIIYQLHVGSFLGRAGNIVRSTFKELLHRLDYFVDLGVNTLQLMPVNEFEGLRDWGYGGSWCMAVSEEYGFWDEGRWVCGTEALKRFVDAAHGKGLRVLCDVVYNHIGGNHNYLWELDGKKNPWFEWEEEPFLLDEQDGPHDMEPYPRNTAGAPSRTAVPSVRHTPWGPIPAYNKTFVRQFFFDHALAMMKEFHFDGIRMDFTHYIHSIEGGGDGDGWRLLRSINRCIKSLYPEALLVAEEFPPHPILVTPPGPNGEGGAGFDCMWNTEFQHRLISGGDGRGLLQQVVRGERPSLGVFVDHLLEPVGFGSSRSGITIISDHDEVGNGIRTINLASTIGDPCQARALCRLVFGLGMLCPGIPMFFQGEEFLAQNEFRWGIYSTWDLEWEWWEDSKDESNELLRFQRCHYEYCKQVIALRSSSPALQGAGEIKLVELDTKDSIFSLMRLWEEDRFLIACNWSGDIRTKTFPVKDGCWKLVLNSSSWETKRLYHKGVSPENAMIPTNLVKGSNRTMHLPPWALVVYRLQ